MPLLALGELTADLEHASGIAVDLVLVDEAPPALAYRIFAEGQLLLECNHRVFVARKARAILEYLDFAPTEALRVRAALSRRSRMVDSAILAAKLAMVRDAVGRIAAFLPPTPVGFRADRNAREIVTLNLFVAIQECLALASHILSDTAWGVPKSYGESFTLLADHGVLEPELAAHMRSAAGLRNLLAHQYGIVDSDRLHEFARDRTADLTAYCAAVASWIESREA